MIYRRAIRELTVAMLTEQGRFNRVFNGRSTPTSRDDLPCCKVWTPSDNGQNLSIGVPEMRGEVTLTLQIIVEGDEDAENAALIDDLCESVVHLLLEDAAWLQSVERVLSLSTTTETNTEGASRTVIATLDVSIQYADVYTTRIIDYLDTIRTKVVLPGQPEPPPGGELQGPSFDVEFERFGRPPTPP